MRSCRFYSPGKAFAEEHDGLALSNDYEFDKPMQQPSCMCPAMIAASNGVFAMCNYEREPVSCVVYEPEQLTILRHVALSEASQEMQLVATRVKFGIVEFYITLIDGDQETTLHTINAHEYGVEAREFSHELFDYELSDRGEFHELPLPEVTTNSYLQEIVDEVRTAI